MDFFIRKQSKLENDEKLNTVVKGLINGHKLEGLLLNSFNCASEVGLSCYMRGKTKMLTIKVQNVHTCYTPLSRHLCKKDVMYLLRPKHPVVDFVGYFGNTLLFIQASIKDYKDHNSKVRDLVVTRNFEFKGSTVLEYYKDIFKVQQQDFIVYCYISPKLTVAHLIEDSSKVKFCWCAEISSQEFLSEVYRQLPYTY